MRLGLLAFLVLLLFGVAILPAHSTSENKKPPASQTFNRPVDAVYAAVVQIASADFNLKSAVKEGSTVTFFTGGANSLVATAICHDHGNGQTIVTLSIAKSIDNPQIFFVSKAKDDLARRFWAKLDSVLKTNEKIEGTSKEEVPRAKTAATPPAEKEGSAPASLAVTSTPSGADIFVDNNFVGSTPSTISVLPGKHVIWVKKAGFKDWEREILVSGGKVNLTVDLVAQ